MGRPLHAVRASLVEILDGMGQADLARAFPCPWGQEGTAYEWVCVYLAHDREHAQGVRGAGRTSGSCAFHSA